MNLTMYPYRFLFIEFLNFSGELHPMLRLILSISEDSIGKVRF